MQVTYVGGHVRTHRYQITISGSLGEIGREAFGDFRVEPNGTDTALVGDLDQAALYGVLNRILTLGLELLELTRLADGNSASAELRAAGPSSTRFPPDRDEFQAHRVHSTQQDLETALV